MHDDDPEGGAASGWIELGVVVRPHGVRGALKIRLHNPNSTVPEEIDAAHMALRETDGRLHETIALGARTGGFLTATAPSVGDREAAERMRSATLLVQRGALSLDPDEYLVADLIGCTVKENDREFGLVRDVMSAGGSHVLVVGRGTEERLIPLVDDWVESVDLERKIIEIRGGDVWDELAGAGGSEGS